MSRTLHAPVREGVLHGLRDIFEGGFKADKVIQRRLKGQRKWGSHDRRLFAESLYDIARWWRRLLFVCDVPWPRSERWSAADDGVYLAVIQAWCGLNQVTLGKNIPPLTEAAVARVKARWSEAASVRAVRESVPDWLDEVGVAQLGGAWDDILGVLNTEAPVYLRANRLKVTPEELVRELGREDIAASAAGPDGVMLARRSNVFLSRSFHAGLFEVQDLHSQLVARALEPRAGERVIDACAGGGGKSLHLAALMGGKGKVLAMDVAEGKLTRLRERANRAGASCIETRVIDGAKVIKRLADSADRLLLDVPCSGLGVWRRNPDGKWRLTAEEIARLKGVQAEILSRYAAMLKPGGLMVYATCSILPDENERQIENFLSHNGNGWELLDQRSLRPAPGGGDGFFVARLRRRS